MEKRIDEIAEGVKNWKLKRKNKSHWNKIAQYDNTNFSIACFVDGKTGRPKTGITMAEARQFEKELGMEEGELGPRSPFWKDFHIKCDDEVMHLDLDDPEDKFTFAFLSQHKLVALGQEELRRKPQAIYVLTNDVVEAKKSVRKRNVKKDAYVLFAGMTNNEMIDMLMVMGEKVLTSEPSIIESQMGALIEKRPAEFLDIYEDTAFQSKLFIMKCVYFNILSLGRGSNVESRTVMFGNEFLGEGMTRAAEYITIPANQKLYIELEKRLELAQSTGTIAGSEFYRNFKDEEKQKLK